MPKGIKGFQKGHKINLGKKLPHIGIPHTEEAKKKMSLAKMGDKNPAKRPEVRKKMNESHKGKVGWWRGKKRPEMMGDNNPSKRLSVKQKISKKLKGKKKSKEHIRKMKEAQKGEKSYNWQGGKSFEPYSLDWTETLRRSIRERDNYICQLCSQYGNVVHHKDYNKKNCDPKNLITLCLSCNFKVNYNRTYWENYFLKKQTGY